MDPPRGVTRGRACPRSLAAAALSILCSRAAGHQPPIWFVSWQHTSHIKALCPIALELQSRGWEVFLGVHDEVRHLAPEGLRTISAGPLPWSWSEELQFRQKLWDPLPLAAENAEHEKALLSEKYFLGSQRSLFEGLNNTLHGLPLEDRPVFFVADVASVGAMDLAQSVDIPYAVVSGWPVGPTLQSIGDPSALQPWLPLELFMAPQRASQQGLVDRIKRAVFSSAIPWLMERNGFHLPRRQLREAVGLPADGIELLELPRWRGAEGRDWPLVLVLTHWGLDRPRSLPAHVALVGPVENHTAAMRARKPLPASVASWLEAGGSHVYVSFGTNVRPRPHILRALLGAMQELAPAFLFLWDAEEQDVLARAALELDDDVEPFAAPSNVKFVLKVDQLAVLATGRLTGFISHCGLNSVHEAMHFGVPVVGLPFLGDQLIMAHLVEEVQAGIRMSIAGIEASVLADAVRQLSSGKHAQAARRIGLLASGAGGAQTAASLVEIQILHGGAHLQSIETRMPHSANMWDVRLSIGAILLLVVAGGFAALWAFCRPEPKEADEKKSK